MELEKGAEVDDAKMESLGKLTERYCTVLQTSTKKPEMGVMRVDAKEEKEKGAETVKSYAEGVKFVMVEIVERNALL